MVGLGTLAKLASGGIGPDEILEIMASMGIDMEMTQITEDGRQGAMRIVASSLVAKGSKTVLLRGRMKGGEYITAVLTMGPDCHVGVCQPSQTASSLPSKVA
jgi:hypothetical protein